MLAVIFLLTFTILSISLTILALKQETQSSRQSLEVDKISVLQPVLGGDAELKSSLLHNLNIYPKVQFIFLVEKDDILGQKAISEALRLSNNSFSFIKNCPAPKQHVNPKMYKLQIGLIKARDICIALDDDCQLTVGSLERIIEGLEDYGLSTGIPHYRSMGNFWSKLIAQFPNSYAMTTYFPLAQIGASRTINGMYFAARKSDLNLVGGYSSVSNYMCDDFQLAQVFLSKGLSIKQTRATVLIHTELRSAKAYWNLFRRWMYNSRNQIGAFLSPLVISLTMFPPLLLYTSLIIGFFQVFFCLYSV